MSEVLAAEAQRIRALRLQMLELHPFWGHLLLHVRVVAAPELPAFAATDCTRHVWYNPLWTRHLAIDELGFVLAHELGHQLFATEARRHGRDRHLWNCATDYAINRIVSEIGHPALPGKKLYRPPMGTYPQLGEVRILLDTKFDGMIAETIYEHLAEEATSAPTSLTLTLPMEGQGSGHGRVSVPGVLDHGGGIDVHLPDGMSAEAREALADRIGGAATAWSRSNRRGHAPGRALRQVALRERRTRVPWRRLLHRYADQALAGVDDYSRQRPNRRYLDHDIIVPGLVGERLGHVVAAVDTSGSMSRRELEAVSAELHHIRSRAAQVTLLIADARVQRVVRTDQLEQFLDAPRFRGGGGTDHRPVFEWVRRHRIRPALFIGLTDLYSEFPVPRPGYPVLWLVPEDHGEAPWGSVVVVEGSGVSPAATKIRSHTSGT